MRNDTPGILDYSEYVKMTGTQGLVNYHYVQDTLAAIQPKRGYCPYCRIKVDNTVFHAENREIDWCDAVESETVIQCNCGWWEHSYVFQSDDVDQGLRATTLELTPAILRKYELDSEEVPIHVLNDYIQRNPEGLFRIHHKKMEELTASVFRDFYDCEVKVVGKSHDGGKDLILIDGDGGQSFVQVKRRTSRDVVESVSGVRELLGVSVVDSAKSCIYVTTADHFSKPAEQLADRAVGKGLFDRFELVDYGDFIERLNLRSAALPNAWDQLIKVAEIRQSPIDASDQPN